MQMNHAKVPITILDYKTQESALISVTKFEENFNDLKEDST